MNEVYTLPSEREILKKKIIYKYDEKGNQIERTIYDENGVPKSKHIYKYDDRGNRIEDSHYEERYQHEKGLVVDKGFLIRAITETSYIYY